MEKNCEAKKKIKKDFNEKPSAIYNFYILTKYIFNFHPNN